MLKTSEAAARLGLHPGTLRRLVRIGEAPVPVYRVGRHWRFDPDDITRYLEGRRRA